MSSKYVAVKDNLNLQRHVSSSAVVSIDHDGLTAYKKRKERENRFNSFEEDINNIKNDLNDIKLYIQALLNK